MGIMSKKVMEELDYKCVNNIKALGIDMINSANSGHPGIVLSAAPIIYTVYAKHLVFDPLNPNWINRDRFVMSCGHGSALLYSTLYMSGFNIGLDDLKDFRKIDSITPGHPEYGVTPGVDVTTGPLGQGLATSVGMAIAERFLNDRYMYDKRSSLFDNFTYCLVGDGDLMEGISYEACSIAGNLELGKLIVLYDSNDMTLDGSTKNSFKEKILDRFKAMNWDTRLVVDGENLDLINDAIEASKKVLDKPSIIEIKTKLGRGSINEDTYTVHGKPLSSEDIIQLKEKLGVRGVPYSVSLDCFNYMKESIISRNKKKIDRHNNKVLKYINKVYSSRKEEIEKLINNDLAINIKNISLSKEDMINTSLRDINSKIINEIVDDSKLIIGGSADLASSCKTNLLKFTEFTSIDYSGRNIAFGVREHAMGAILNGITLSGVRSYGSTFLGFSNYLIPAIRMASLMNLPVIYIFTHDSVAIGEDGPTHQPVEQLIQLRSIPNVNVYRPFDANEVIGAYKNALVDNNPSVIIISKDPVNTIKDTKINEVVKGAYIVKNETDTDLILTGSGNELQVLLDVHERLKERGIKSKVVSMVSMENFDKQNDKYKLSVFPKDSKIIALEYAHPYSWYKYTDKVIGISSFGCSGKRGDVLKKYNLDYDSVFKKIEELINS